MLDWLKSTLGTILLRITNDYDYYQDVLYVQNWIYIMIIKVWFKCASNGYQKYHSLTHNHIIVPYSWSFAVSKLNMAYII